MRTTSVAATCLAATLTLALPATLAFASRQATDAATPSSTEISVAGEVAQDVLALLTETYESAHDEVFVTGDADSSLEASTEAITDVPTTVEGEELLLATVGEIVADASDPAFDLSIDETHAEVTSEPVVEVLGDGAISVTSDVTITRHISEHDVDWVEVVPHEVTVSRTGDVTDVVVHDLEQQLEDTAGAVS